MCSRAMTAKGDAAEILRNVRSRSHGARVSRRRRGTTARMRLTGAGNDTRNGCAPSMSPISDGSSQNDRPPCSSPLRPERWKLMR